MIRKNSRAPEDTVCATGGHLDSCANWLLKKHLRRRNKETSAQSSQFMSVVKHKEHIFQNPTNLGFHSSSPFH